jgi:hypothetical protein
MEQELLTLPEHLSLLCVPRENAANTNFIIFGSEKEINLSRVWRMDGCFTMT